MDNNTMKQKNGPVIIMADGDDAVIILKGFLKRAPMESIYESAGRIADNVMKFTLHANEAKDVTVPELPDPEPVMPDGAPYAGQSPHDALSANGPKAVLPLSQYAESNPHSEISLNIDEAIYNYSVEFMTKNVKDAEEYAGKLTVPQSVYFLRVFGRDRTIRNQMINDLKYPGSYSDLLAESDLAVLSSAVLYLINWYRS